MSCVSRSDLIWYLAGLEPAVGTHINTCAACRRRGESNDISHAIDAVREVPDAKPGATIDGKYVVREILGAGTFGLVIRAAPRSNGPEVAVKLLRPKFNRDQETLARFEREARILAKLRSPRICRSLASGTTKSGTQYIVTEYLRGETLRSLLERRRTLPVSLAARFIVQTCEALGEAHANGVVHRDLKPDNIFIISDDGDVKLLDFGVARALHDPRLTGSAQFMGSPLYMAPEQLSNPKGVGPAADIWALGVILQELVTGIAPFHGPTVAVVCSRILDGLRDELDGPGRVLEPIIDRCLQHHPENRYASVTELVVQLASYTVAPAATPSPAITPPSTSAGVATTLPPDAPEPNDSVTSTEPNEKIAAPPNVTTAARTPTRPTKEPTIGVPRRKVLLIAGGSIALIGIAIVIGLLARDRTREAERDAPELVSAPPPRDATIFVEPIEPDAANDTAVVTIAIDAAPVAIEVDAGPPLSEQLTKAQVREGFASVQRQTNACIARFTPLLDGRVQVRVGVSVHPAGDVHSVGGASACTPGDEECRASLPATAQHRADLVGCLEAALRQARFPRSRYGADTSKDFNVRGTKPKWTASAEGTPPVQPIERAPSDKERTGVLLIGSSPISCEIYIDGTATGLHTPQRDIKLGVGRHTITLINNEFGIKETFPVEIFADAPTKVIKDLHDRVPP